MSDSHKIDRRDEGTRKSLQESTKNKYFDMLVIIVSDNKLFFLRLIFFLVKLPQYFEFQLIK